MAGRTQRARSGGRSRSKTLSAWPVFLIAHDELVARIEETLRDNDLPEISWYTVLWVLERAPEQRLRMHELSEAAVISRSNLTRLVDRMEKAGLVARERVSGDRRGAYARLTPAGRDKKTEMWKVYGPAIQEHFSARLSPEENSILHDIMQRLIDNVRSSRT